MKVKFIAVIFSFVFLSMSANAGEYLTGDQIKELFTNNTIDIYLVDRGMKKVVAYSRADGSRLIHITWKDMVKKRKWWVQGNQACGSHPKRGDFCRSIKKISDDEYHAFEDGEKMRVLKNIRAGNQIDG